MNGHEARGVAAQDGFRRRGRLPPDPPLLGHAPVQPSSSKGASEAVSVQRRASQSNSLTAPLVVSASRRQAASQESLARPAPSLRGATRRRPAGE